MDGETLAKAMQDRAVEKTLRMRINALRRVERAEGIDLDVEFDRDEMADLLARFSYSRADERQARPNPTNIKINSRSVRNTLAWYRSHLNQYRKFRLSDPEADDLPEDEIEDPGDTDDSSVATTTFGLEADMQAALREEIGQLEPGLRIVDGGAERKIASGFIDILAMDPGGTHVVIELKAGAAKDAVVAQTLGYMGDVAEETGTAVRGIIVAAAFRPRIVSAARAVPNLRLKTYAFNFEFA